MLMRCKRGNVRRWAAAGAAGALALTAIPLVGVASAQPLARVASTCGLGGKYRTLGPTYTEKLSVSHTSCTTGEKVVTSYNKCRLKAGGAKGYCRSKVLGFKCSEKRPQSSAIQYIAEVKCSAGSKSVDFTYSENT
jgi:hypothetical protein